jgi:hypothetical protein
VKFEASDLYHMIYRHWSDFPHIPKESPYDLLVTYEQLLHDITVVMLALEMQDSKLTELSTTVVGDLSIYILFNDTNTLFNLYFKQYKDSTYNFTSAFVPNTNYVQYKTFKDNVASGKFVQLKVSKKVSTYKPI